MASNGNNLSALVWVFQVSHYKHNQKNDIKLKGNDFTIPTKNSIKERCCIFWLCGFLRLRVFIGFLVFWLCGFLILTLTGSYSPSEKASRFQCYLFTQRIVKCSQLKITNTCLYHKKEGFSIFHFLHNELLHIFC